MKNSCRKILLIFVIACIFILFGTSSVFAVTMNEIVAEFEKRDSVKNLKECDISIPEKEKNKINITGKVSDTESYSNTFIFEEERCKFVLKGQDDQTGLKLAKDMWFTIVDLAEPSNEQEATGTTNTETGETLNKGEKEEQLWNWIVSQVDQDTINFGADYAKESDGSYVVYINTKAYKVNISDSDSKPQVQETPNIKNDNMESSYITNIKSVPNAGINIKTINILKVVIGIAGFCILAFTVYNIKNSLKNK